MYVLKQTYNICGGKSHLLCTEQRTQSILKEEKNIIREEHIFPQHIINVDLLMLAKILLCRPNCSHTNTSLSVLFLF